MKAAHTPGLIDQYWSDEPNALDKIERGQFEITTEPSGQVRFWFVCPGPCKTLAPLAIRPVVDGSAQSWQWDSNTESPTLHPSINHNGCWHGWLTAGQFNSC